MNSHRDISAYIAAPTAVIKAAIDEEKAMDLVLPVIRMTLLARIRAKTKRISSLPTMCSNNQDHSALSLSGR